MYRSRQIRIKRKNPLSEYCRYLCLASGALYNRANYILRQYATAARDISAGKELTANQAKVWQLVKTVTKGTKYVPAGMWLTYGQLDYLLKTTKDPAYTGLPAQANQQILKNLMRNYKAFFEALKAYASRPETFTGRPKMPGYKKKGTPVTAVLTNQICRIKDSRYLKFPGTKKVLDLGELSENCRLKEVKVKPEADSYTVHVILQMEDTAVEHEENTLCRMREEELKSYLIKQRTGDIRTLSIDPGVENFCAASNNFGERPFVVKGTILKSENRYYNKELARLKAEAMKCSKAHITRRIRRLHGKRSRIIKDQMHKISRWITEWAKEKDVKLVVLGHNVYQKQKADMGHISNQKFVQIPHKVFAGMLRYKLKEAGIAFLEMEESYTSKADYLAKDTMPVYEQVKQEKADKQIKFSGKRIKRGLYRHENGWISNADINGAANILRKVFPNETEWDRGAVDAPYAVRIA